MTERTHTSTPSLVKRLVTSAVLWTLPVLAFTAIALTFLYRSATYKVFDDPLENAITDLISSVETGGANGPSAEIFLTREPIDPDYQRSLSGRYWMIGEYQDDGTLRALLASRSLSDGALQLPRSIKTAIESQTAREFRTSSIGPDNEQLRVLASPIILPDGRAVVLMAGADVMEQQKDIRRFALLSTLLMLLVSGGVVGAIFWQVRNGLRPLFTLQQKVADIREGRAEKVDGTYPKEIAPLADELNTLISHNKDVVERARTHVSNLAHGLKTPIAVLQNEAQTSKSEFAGIVQRQTETMKRQVDHHLHRARAAARGQVIGVITPVEDVIIPLARTLERIYRDKDIDFDINISKGLVFRGEKRDLEEMAGNLLDNACKWTKSQVHVRAKMKKSDNTMMQFTVFDDGPGLKKGQYEEALKRGARLDETTPGTGFGLPIVDDLARAYKGGLQLGKAKIGGLRIDLILPGRIELGAKKNE